MSDIETRARELFLQAFDQQPDQIARFLNDACDDDDELRQRVQKLLDAHEQAGNFLAPSHMNETVIKDAEEPDVDDFPKTTASASPRPGTSIGPYRLLEQIGEGGMGSVWVASQSQPIKRKVAIKLIRAGMDSRQVLARFEAERQALAMMDHPNIARVLDGGMTEQERPYFAMEYVKGVPLTEYCDHARLSVRERLELFVPICQAVQHAHQKGIIHRDLKPSNILVCLYDGKPVAKVIDFGLAKAMHQSLTEHSLYTAHGMMVGTPLYMSPEQAELNNLDIDTRTDVYALGVILYELLTGTTPLEKGQMREAAYNEVLRLIKEVEPPKPSMRLSGSDSLPSVAAQRSIDPAQLTRSLMGDLDWVVMKALEKERSRRYETANGLAEDIRRHLCDEPVSASPPSVSYRVRKFIRRNRAGVIAATTIAVTLLLGVAGTTGGMFWALAEKKDAIIARQAESEAKQKAMESAARARDEADRATAAEQKAAETLREVEAERDAKELARKEAEQLSEFLTNVFQSPDPTRDGREIKVVELLDNAAKKLESELVNQPRQRAKLQVTLGMTYLALGLPREAIPLLESARDFYFAKVGREHRDALAVMNALANACEEAGRREEVLPIREEVLVLCRKVIGPESPETLLAMNNLAKSYHLCGRLTDGMQIQQEMLELSRKTLGSEHSHTIMAMNNLAICYSSAGREDEALKLKEEVLNVSCKVLGSEHPQTITAMGSLALSYDEQGRHLEAIKLQEEAMALSRKILGPEHPKTVLSMGHLAISLSHDDRHDEAIKLQEDVLAVSRRVLGPEHPETLRAMGNLAVFYGRTNRQGEAIQMQSDVLTLNRKVLGSEHHLTLKAMINLGNFYENGGRRDEALRVQEEIIALQRKTLGLEHPDTLQSMKRLTGMAGAVAIEYAWERKIEEHARLIHRLSNLVTDSKDYEVLEQVARVVCIAPNADTATFQNAVKLVSKAQEFGKDDPEFQGIARLTLGMVLYRAGEFAEAEAVLSTWKSFHEGYIGGSSSFFLAMALFRQGNEEAARDLFAVAREKMSTRPEKEDEQIKGMDHYHIFVWLACREADALINK